MRTNILSSFLFFVLICIGFNPAFGQVTKVKYLLTFQPSSAKYTVHMIPAQGSATTTSQKTQGLARVSLVGNQNKLGTITPHAPFIDPGLTSPTAWTAVDSAASAGIVYYAITPSTFQLSQYGNLSVGDTVPIFSFEAKVPDPCGSGFRLYENAQDSIVSFPGNLVPTSKRFHQNFAFANDVNVYNGNAIASNRPQIISQPPYCVGDTVKLKAPANTIGTFASSNPSVGIISNDTLLILNASGTTTVVFSLTGSTCSYSLPPITAGAKPVINLANGINLCTGTTFQYSASINFNPVVGTWNSTSPTSLVIDNAGLATAIAPGSSTLVFVANNGCTSDPSAPISINQGPVLALTGSSNVCIGGTTTVTPTSGGMYTSTDIGVISVTNTGVITGVGVGSASVQFINSANGCLANLAAPINVSVGATLTLSGSSSLCVGETTMISATTAGIWSVSNPAVASINANTGVITAISLGTTLVIHTNAAGCVTVTSNPIIVIQAPVITGSLSSICVGTTKQLTGSVVGQWVTDNPTVATVNPSGLVTAINGGMANIILINQTSGCQSLKFPITVNSKPIIQNPGGTLCVNGTQLLNSNTVGTWSTTTPTIVSITPNGLVTALSFGTGKILFTDNNGCKSDTLFIQISNTSTATITGPTSICVGGTTQVSAATPIIGTWTSSNPSVASVNSNGLVTGLAPGMATFTFTSTSTGCIFTPTAPVTVHPNPTLPNFTSPTCVGIVSTLPNIAGVYASNNPTIISVNNNTKTMTALAPGTATITLTNSFGCVATSNAIIVSAPTTIPPLNDNQLCIGDTTHLPNVGSGTWISANNAIATVNNNGIVMAVSPGFVRMRYTNPQGCISQSDEINILPSPQVVATQDTLCIGGTSILSPSTNGQWSFTNPNIATVTPNGLVTAVGTGTAFFQFTNSFGCESALLPIYVAPTPASLMSFGLCLGSTTQISPTQPGIWESSNPQVLTVTPSGIFTTVSAGTSMITFTSPLGCKSAPATVTVSPKPNAQITAVPSACLGTEITVSASGGVFYAWSNGKSTSSFTVPVSSTTYTVTVSDANGCAATATKSITALQLPVPTISGPSELCIGDSIAIFAAGGVSYTWQTAQNFPNITIFPTSTTTYTVTVVDLNGCSATASKTITVNPLPILTVTQNQIMVGQTANIGSNAIGTWQSLNTNIASVVDNQRVLGNAPGIAILLFTDAAHGCQDTIKIQVMMSSDIDDITFDNVKIYPNPSQNDLIIEGLSAETDVDIYHTNGRKMSINDRSNIHTQEWSSGMYIIALSLDNHRKYIRWVKL